VTWLWTVNIINDTQAGKIPNPTPWWPGDSYVTWVGIDGYYLKSSWRFAPLFGPTIGAVRTLTSKPILIAETAATPETGQTAKIADLFAGIRAYGLLGFVWFNSTNSVGQQFSINNPAAIAAFSKGATTFTRPGS
jgi:mannan endo-1,4-beta-mannosidase